MSNLRKPDTDAQDPNSGYPRTANDIISLLSCYIDDRLRDNVRDDIDLSEDFLENWEHNAARVIEPLVAERDRLRKELVELLSILVV